MTTRRASIVRAPIVVLAALLPPLLLAGHWTFIRSWEPLGIHNFVDTHDIAVYFASSRWVAGGAPLYSGSPSEYPLLANLVFAATRLVSEVWMPVPDAAGSFEATWVTFGWWMWLGLLATIWRLARRRAAWMWLTPAALYFTLYRFDVYPVAATLAALLLARSGRLRMAALLLGLAIGLKGYALFALPAFAVWVWRERGRREAVVAGAIAIAPLAASVLLVLGLAGPAAAIYPFRVQAIRGSNGESTWDVIALLLGRSSAHVVLAQVPLLPFVLQILSALGAAALRPRTFDAFLRAFIVGVGGFVTFSVFYSPQFYLWFVPAVALADSLGLLVPMVALSWLTIAYFPLLYVYGKAVLAYRLVVIAVAVARTSMIGLAGAQLRGLRTPGDDPRASPPRLRPPASGRP